MDDFVIPRRFRRAGRIVGFGSDVGTLINGDPAIVWDDDAGAWRMFYFALPPGHAQAVCVGPDGDPARAASWELLGPLPFTNPAALPDGLAFKPFPILDAHRPGQAARVFGRYWLLILLDSRQRRVHRAHAPTLAGPWTIEPDPLIPIGNAGDFDGAQVEAPSGYWFPDRDEFVYFYMGTPGYPQAGSTSPLGSVQAAALQRRGESVARKVGPILPPSPIPGHWAAGWVGGLQLVGRCRTGWVALVNAGPNAPRPGDDALTKDEPPPSLGGWATTDAPFPITGWRFLDPPIERIEDVPQTAIDDGEGTNLWRHFLLTLPSGRRLLLYNSGPYFREQLFCKIADDAP